MQEFHEGVGLLISNSNRSRFYIQLKDATYPIPKWRGACSFWGGAVESEDENEEAAVWRELREEIPQALNIITTILPINRYLVTTERISFGLSVFEACIDNSQLNRLSKGPVHEGIGCLISQKDLLNHKWIFDMGFIFKSYLDELKKNNKKLY